MSDVSRLERVAHQCRTWAQKLTDLSRRNRLLHFRPLKKGTLPLNPAAEAVSQLLAGETVSLSDVLVPPDNKVEAFARAREIARTALSNLEERGLATLFLALDTVGWIDPMDQREATTPLALLPIALEQKGVGGSRISVAAAGALMANPVLVHSWQQTFGVLPPEGLDEASGDEPRLALIRGWSTANAAAVNGFARRPAAFLDNFSFQKMAMVQELSTAPDVFAESDLVAALAGAKTPAVTSRNGDSVDLAEIDRKHPEDEFLVLDADSSQLRVIESVLRGQSGVIHGPPGTGKSQTIANLIAALSATGKRILFVAEKRAALDVVKDRLAAVGLGHLVLDLHGADVSRKAIAAQVARALETVSTSAVPDVRHVHDRFIQARGALTRHVAALHNPCAVTGSSPHEMLGEMLRAKVAAPVRFRGQVLRRLTPACVDEISRTLDENTHLSAIVTGAATSGWMAVADVDAAAMLELIDAVAQLSDATSRWRRDAYSIAARYGLGQQPLLALADALEAYEKATRILSRYRGGLRPETASDVAMTLVPAGGAAFRRIWAFLTDRRYRETRRVLLAARTSPASVRTLFEEAQELFAALMAWSAHATGTLPVHAQQFGDVLAATAEVRASIARVESRLPLNLMALSMGEIDALAGRLLAETATARLVPAGRALGKSLNECGLASFLSEMRRHAVDPRSWSVSLRLCWMASAVDELMLSDPALQAATRTNLDASLSTFRETDATRVKLAAPRVRRRHAEHALAVFDANGSEHQLLKREAAKKARHMPFRELLSQSGSALTALFPCVMASPLSVSQLLPVRSGLFDVVIFDEASQVQPEDAVAALLRGKQVVAAGDPKQLPPTAFFASEAEQEEENDALGGLESVLDALLSWLPSWKLAWHYRSRDERLIAYSNRAIYQDGLITFPGTNQEVPVAFESVPSMPRDGDEDSAAEEVRRVVAHILDHARYDGRSLGVITMGIKHRNRIQHALDAALAEQPELAPFFDVSKKDRFFIKNLEQVQGDERDVIFLSIGYGKSADGRLPYRFGPLLQAGGERRLNVATTRARCRMVVFASFTHLDMDPARSTSAGVKFLRGFLEFAERGGQVIDGVVSTAAELNPFEEDVRLALCSRGLSVVPQLGVSNYRIDLAVQHPDQPGRFVLAVECDGASYHSAPTARDRDRLRQQQLQALGWNVYRIWSTDWFERRNEELERVIAHYQQVLKDVDAADVSTAAPPTSAVDALADVISDSPLGRGPKPWVPPDPKIDSLRSHVIDDIVEWVKGDGRLRTEDELLSEVAKALGFRRLGPRIRQRISDRIRVASSL